MTTASCIYEGTIHHRRSDPPREFRHPLALAYLDLGELPELLGGRLVKRSPGVARFRREDYLGRPEISLDKAVRDTVAATLGREPEGPVRVLTQLRSFGHCFNPVSFYYCFDSAARQLEAVAAEVTNTPWGERHVYVVPHGEGSFGKALHVSPFMAMNHVYDCRVTVPGESLSVHIGSRREGSRVFEARLALRRRELTRRSLASLSARYPLAGVRVLALIYMHAVGLRFAGAPVYPHPSKART